ncbi:MAG: glycosyltransferase [Planctomycetota bacterium]|jgi:glycosyltransferase involved in cell wall biosynthesis
MTDREIPRNTPARARAASRVRSVGLVNHVPYCELDGRFFLRAQEAKALWCWTSNFRHTLLLKPVLRTDQVPEGWLELPGDLAAEPLYEVTEQSRPGFLARRSRTRSAVRRALPRLGLLYLRVPAWETSWAWAAARGSGVPQLVEQHGDWESAARADYQERPGGRWLAPAVARWVFARTRRMTEGASVRCFVGEALKRKYGPGLPGHLTTAHLIAEPEFTHREDTCQDETIRVLFIGVLAPYKGIKHLVECVSALRERGHPIRLEVVGDGPLRGALESRVAELGLAEHTTFHGYVPAGSAVWDHSRRADVFVLPSIAGEGVPRVIQEAMAQCCPVVATDVGSVRYQLGDGRYGIVVPPGDEAALAEAISRIIEDGASRRALIAAAFEEARSHTYESQIAQVRAILDETLDPELLADPRGRADQSPQW